MIGWIKKKLKEHKDRRMISRQIRPEAFLSLAEEIRELARAAGMLGPPEERYQEKVRRIEQEMRQLRELAQKPEFRRLSQAKRLILRQSIIQSREQLLETVQNVPAPTPRLQ